MRTSGSPFGGTLPLAQRRARTLKGFQQAKVDIATLERILIDEGTKKLTERQRDLVQRIANRRASIGTTTDGSWPRSRRATVQINRNHLLQGPS